MTKVQEQNQAVVEDKTVYKTVTMYPEQWSVVEAVNERYGFRNLSSALRFIVNEFGRNQAASDPS